MRAEGTTAPVIYARAILTRSEREHTSRMIVLQLLDKGAATLERCLGPCELLGLAICIPGSGHLIARVISGAGVVGGEYATH